MSEEAGVKPVYDKYYVWPSGYVHGHWGAVRDTVFDLCLNPLHRYHRIPSPPRRDMGSVAGDAIKLVNLLLVQLNTAYPPFKPRVTAVKGQATQAASAPPIAASEPGAASAVDASNKDAPRFEIETQLVSAGGAGGESEQSSS
jgi:hypothetical protein